MVPTWKRPQILILWLVTRGKIWNPNFMVGPMVGYKGKDLKPSFYGWFQLGKISNSHFMVGSNGKISNTNFMGKISNPNFMGKI